jgi:hypothetical protein
MSTSGTTRVVEVDGDQVRSYEVTPEDVGLARAERRRAHAGTPDVNAQTTRQIFSGEPRAPRATSAVLNAGAAIYVSGTVDSLQDGVRAAEAAIDDGRATKAWTPSPTLNQRIGPRMSVLDRIVDDARDEVTRRRERCRCASSRRARRRAARRGPFRRR